MRLLLQVLSRLLPLLHLLQALLSCLVGSRKLQQLYPDQFDQTLAICVDVLRFAVGRRKEGAGRERLDSLGGQSRRIGRSLD
jgi:hypothetical protein